MGVYDSLPDVPFQIKNEGEKIAVSWKPGVPTASTPGVPNSAEGTISWNIPAPARGCATKADGTSAYCGIVVVAHTQPLTVANRPVDGEAYLCPDPTVDADKHAGDTLGGALVIGAFYEGEQKARGEDLTTQLVVTDVDAETPYYIAVHAVDCQFRYHLEGVRAYSAPYRSAGEEDTVSTQVIELGSGVDLTDPTNLTVGQTYMFDLVVSNTYPNVQTDQVIHIEFDGADAQTYEQLISAIQQDIVLHICPSCVFTGSPCDPPNTGQYCLSDGVIKQYDGTDNETVDGVLYEATDPASVADGDYWYNPTTEELYIRDTSGSPDVWTQITDITISNADPTDTASCDKYWLNGSHAYKWCGTTWCEQVLYVSTTDPSLAPDLGCVVFWYDEANETLFEWDDDNSTWNETYAIIWNVAPNALVVGTYWFDSTNNKLFQLESGSPLWTEIPNTEGSPAFAGSPTSDRLVISTTEPTSPTVNLHWYNPTTELLRIRNASDAWVLTPVLVWPDDPSDTESCDLWWNSVDDKLYKWDTVHSEWDEVAVFVKSDTDPFTPTAITVNSLWYNSDDETLKRWLGTSWESVEFIADTDDPVLPAVNSVWHDPDDDKWYVWTASPNTWDEIFPVDSSQDPTMLAIGTLWFNTATELFYRRSAGSPVWVSVAYETSCQLPDKGTLWYDSCNEQLKMWNCREWVVTNDEVPVTVKLTSDGHLQFTSIAKGSKAVVLVVVPSTVESEVADKTGYSCLPVVYTETTRHSFGFYGPDPCLLPPSELQSLTKNNGVTKNNFLFRAINISKILPQHHGFDGVPDQPTYRQLGVGDDGTPDERRQLMSWIREQLGYPSIKVELTNQQLDIAVRKALDVFRMRSSLAYKRGFYFLDIIPGLQNYKLTSKQNGYNKIVTIMGAFRFTSAFLSSAHGAGVYGQVVLPFVQYGYF